jgi:hypothetical protein
LEGAGDGEGELQAAAFKVCVSHRELQPGGLGHTRLGAALRLGCSPEGASVLASASASTHLCLCYTPPPPGTTSSVSRLPLRGSLPCGATSLNSRHGSGGLGCVSCTLQSAVICHVAGIVRQQLGNGVEGCSVSCIEFGYSGRSLSESYPVYLTELKAWVTGVGRGGGGFFLERQVCKQKPRCIISGHMHSTMPCTGLSASAWTQLHLSMLT